MGIVVYQCCSATTWAQFGLVEDNYVSDFQLGFRGTLGFRKHLSRVPRLVSEKNNNNLAYEITSDQAIEVLLSLIHI